MVFRAPADILSIESYVHSATAAVARSSGMHHVLPQDSRRRLEHMYFRCR
jgi:hypothetical protein